MTLTLAAATAALSLLIAAPAPATSPPERPAPKPAPAAAPPPALTKACDAEAGKRTGRARRAFVKQCVADKQAAQEAEKRSALKRCNTLASEQDLRGRERTLFVSDCVRKK